MNYQPGEYLIGRLPKKEADLFATAFNLFFSRHVHLYEHIGVNTCSVVGYRKWPNKVQSEIRIFWHGWNMAVRGINHAQIEPSNAGVPPDSGVRQVDQVKSEGSGFNSESLASSVPLQRNVG